MKLGRTYDKRFLGENLMLPALKMMNSECIIIRKCALRVKTNSKR